MPRKEVCAFWSSWFLSFVQSTFALGAPPYAAPSGPWGARTTSSPRALEASAWVSDRRLLSYKTVWPSGLRRWLQAPVRKGVGSNPTAVMVAFWRSNTRAPPRARARIHACARRHTRAYTDACARLRRRTRAHTRAPGVDADRHALARAHTYKHTRTCARATPRRFEPLRAEPNGFRVHLLSRSDTLSWYGMQLQQFEEFYTSAKGKSSRKRLAPRAVPRL